MLEIALAALAGLLVGSFLNVCIYRLPLDLSIARPRSFCPACECQIAWWDNIPLLSFALLGGRCRHCRKRIPLRYPLVEALTAILFAAAIHTQGVTPQAFRQCLFCALLTALVASDLEERILPDEFTLGGTLMGLVAAWWIPVPRGLVSMLLPQNWGPGALSLAESAAGAAIGSGSVWLVGAAYHKIRGREGLGFGDVKMVAMMGAFLGLEGALLALLLGSLLGSVIGLAYILIARKDAATYELPFGSFLGVAGVVVSFLRQRMMP